MTADHVEATVRPGEVRLRGVSRKFRILSEQNATLKEVLLRRRRTVGRDLWALRDVDLDVEPGEAIGIVGENGAGKSTLLKLVAGILYPQAGTIEVGGSVASMLELGAGFHPDFTGRENVYMNGSIHGLSEREIDQRFDDIVAFSELGEFVDMPVKTYSSGMHMRLAFAVSSHLSPDILLLDEVLAVGDEAFQRKCMGRIFEFRRRGAHCCSCPTMPARSNGFATVRCSSAAARSLRTDRRTRCFSTTIASWRDSASSRQTPA